MHGQLPQIILNRDYNSRKIKGFQRTYGDFPEQLGLSFETKEISS